MHYVPLKEADFVEWSANLIAVAKAHSDEWDVSLSQIAELETLHNEFNTLYELCKTSNYTKLDMQAKNEKKALLNKKERVFVRNNLQNNDKMTDNGRKELQIPIHDKVPTPHPAPTTVPTIEISTPLLRTVRIKFRGENALRWGKEAYVHGLECLWSVLDTPPTVIEDLLHSSFTTRNPLDLSFDEDQRGKRVYFTVRWESGVAKKGPWSDIFSAVIP
jgi:hypothetical protein